jgi:hypothetical protein
MPLIGLALWAALAASTAGVELTAPGFASRFAAKSALFLTDPAARNAAISVAPERLVKKVQVFLNPSEPLEVVADGLAATSAAGHEAVTTASGSISAWLQSLTAQASELANAPAGAAWAAALLVALFTVMREGGLRQDEESLAGTLDAARRKAQAERVRGEQLAAALSTAQDQLSRSTAFERSSREALRQAQAALDALDAPRRRRREEVQQRAAELRAAYGIGAERRARVLLLLAREAADARAALSAIDAGQQPVQAAVGTRLAVQPSVWSEFCAERRMASQASLRSQTVARLQALARRERPIREAQVRLRTPSLPPACCSHK